MLYIKLTIDQNPFQQMLWISGLFLPWIFPGKKRHINSHAAHWLQLSSGIRKLQVVAIDQTIVQNPLQQMLWNIGLFFTVNLPGTEKDATQTQCCSLQFSSGIKKKLDVVYQLHNVSKSFPADALKQWTLFYRKSSEEKTPHKLNSAHFNSL